MKLKSVYRNFGLEHVSGAVDKREAVGSRVVGAPTGGSYPGRGAARHSRAPSRLCYRPWRASGHRCHMGCGVWRPGSVPRPRSQVPPGSAVRDRRAGRPPAPGPAARPPPAGAGTARRYGPPRPRREPTTKTRSLFLLKNFSFTRDAPRHGHARTAKDVGGSTLPRHELTEGLSTSAAGRRR